MSIHIHTLNAVGTLDNNLVNIKSAFKAATINAKKFLQVESADVVVSNSPYNTIPEIGVGGYTDSANKTIYLSVNSDIKLSSKAVEMCLNHELYHLARHSQLGIPKSLKDRVIDEGLACLYEFEISGEIPIYAQQEINYKYLHLFIEHKDDEGAINKWFFGGEGIPKWFAYSLGFNLVKTYKDHTNKAAYQMIGIKNHLIYNKTLLYTNLF